MKTDVGQGQLQVPTRRPGLTHNTNRNLSRTLRIKGFTNLNGRVMFHTELLGEIMAILPKRKVVCLLLGRAAYPESGKRPRRQ